MKKKIPKSFAELQKEWYHKIATIPDDNGEVFKDIEDVDNPDRPLLEWHSFKFIAADTQVRKVKRADYQAQIDSFRHHPEFHNICDTVTRHGNARFTSDQARQIWDMHCEGKTVRAIGKQMECPYRSVAKMIAKLKGWMDLL